MSSLAASLVTGVGLRPERTLLYQPTSFPSSRRKTHGVVKASARVDKFSKSDIIVSPSILSANFAKLGEQVKAVELAGCDWIHVDVMDGRFVPNITIGPLVVDALRPVTDLPLDVHLMIVEPEQRVPDFIKAGADIVSVHCEQSSTIHLHRTVDQIPRDILLEILGYSKVCFVEYHGRWVVRSRRNGYDNSLDIGRL